MLPQWPDDQALRPQPGHERGKRGRDPQPCFAARTAGGQRDGVVEQNRAPAACPVQDALGDPLRVAVLPFPPPGLPEHRCEAERGRRGEGGRRRHPVGRSPPERDSPGHLADRVARPPQVVPGAPRGAQQQRSVHVGVHGELMPSSEDLGGQRAVGTHLAAHGEERSLYRETVQRGQHRGSSARGRTVVEGEGNMVRITGTGEPRPKSADRGQTKSTRSRMSDHDAGHGQTGERGPCSHGPVVVLSGGLGSGHEAAAQAVRAALPDTEVTVLDCMALLGRSASRVGEAVFRRMISVPAVYDALYFGALRPGGRLADAMDAAARARLLPAVRARLPDQPPLFVAVFPTGASTAATLRREGSARAAVELCTDATAHRLWVHGGIDTYAVNGRVAAASVRRHDPQARVQVLPAPVRPQVWQAPPRDEARALLGLDDRPCVLLLTGGWGLAPVIESAVEMAQRGIQVVAVAGRNARLHTALCQAARDQPGLHPLGWTNDLPRCMAAADLVVSPSGQSCHEARALGRRLVVLDTMPGHGRDNVQQELAWGARLSGVSPRHLVPAALAALEADPEPAPNQRPQEFAVAFNRLLSTLPT